MTKRLFYSLLVVYIFGGCTSDLANQMKKFSGSSISFDLSLTQIQRDSLDTQYRIGSEAAVRFVVLYDSTECSSCRVNTLDQFEDIHKLMDRRGERVTPIIIFSPASEQLRELKRDLQLRELAIPVYIDSCHLFGKINPQIPADRRLHAFLLNRNNEVVLIGNPVNNPQLWALYESTAKTL